MLVDRLTTDWKGLPECIDPRKKEIIVSPVSETENVIPLIPFSITDRTADEEPNWVLKLKVWRRIGLALGVHNYTLLPKVTQLLPGSWLAHP